MDKTSILVWNVRGINDKGRRDNIRKVVHDFRPSVVCLLETKLSHISDHDVASFLGREFSEFVFRPAQRTRGGARAFLLLDKKALIPFFMIKRGSFSRRLELGILLCILYFLYWWFGAQPTRALPHCTRKQSEGRLVIAAAVRPLPPPNPHPPLTEPYLLWSLPRPLQLQSVLCQVKESK